MVLPDNVLSGAWGTLQSYVRSCGPFGPWNNQGAFLVNLPGPAVSFTLKRALNSHRSWGDYFGSSAITRPVFKNQLCIAMTISSSNNKIQVLAIVAEYCLKFTLPARKNPGCIGWGNSLVNTLLHISIHFRLAKASSRYNDKCIERFFPVLKGQEEKMMF